MDSPNTTPISGAKLFVFILFSKIVMTLPSIINIIAEVNTVRLNVELNGISVIRTIIVGITTINTAMMYKDNFHLFII